MTINSVHRYAKKVAQRLPSWTVSAVNVGGIGPHVVASNDACEISVFHKGRRLYYAWRIHSLGISGGNYIGVAVCLDSMHDLVCGHIDGLRKLRDELAPTPVLLGMPIRQKKEAPVTGDFMEHEGRIYHVINQGYTVHRENPDFRQVSFTWEGIGLKVAAII